MSPATADHDQDQHRDADAGDLESPRAGEEEARHVDLHARALRQHDGVLEEDRRADRADERARGASAPRSVERAVGEALQADAQHARERAMACASMSGTTQAGWRPADLRLEEQREDPPAHVGADHEDLAVGEVDHEQDAVDHRVAERDEPVDGPQGQPEDELLRQDREDRLQAHGVRPPRGTRGGCGPPRAAPRARVVDDDPAVLEHVAAAGDAERHRRVLLDDEDRGALAVDGLDDVEDLVDQRRRQAHRRLVHQQEPRPRHQRAADREHLLLAAGERAALLVRPLPEPGEQPVDALEVLRPARRAARCWRV